MPARVGDQVGFGIASTRVFEQLSDVGGRTKTRVVDGVRLNTGAMFVYRGTHTDKLCAELGIDYEPVDPRTFGIHINGKTVLGKRSEDLAHMLPVSDEARQDIKRLVDSLSSAYSEHGKKLADADRLVRDSTSRGYVPDGMQAIFNGLYHQVSDLLSLGTTVHEITPNPDGSWEVRYSEDGVQATVTAERVVVAVPGPSAVVDCTDRLHWDDFFYVASVGTKFHGVTQPRTGPYFSPGTRNRTYFEMFRGRDSIDQLHAQDDSIVIGEWLEDFYRAAFACPRYDRGVYLRGVREPVGTMHFAGDYTSDSAGSHGALSEADRVAVHLRAELDR